MTDHVAARFTPEHFARHGERVVRVLCSWWPAGEALLCRVDPGFGEGVYDVPAADLVPVGITMQRPTDPDYWPKGLRSQPQWDSGDV